MKIAYIFDQVLPYAEADVEQVMNSMSAMSKLDDVDVTFFLPASNTHTNASADDLRAYYHVNGPFSIELYHSIFPGPRVLEKVAHPLICARYAKVLRSFDLIYCRNIPAVLAALSLRIPVMMDAYRPWPEQYPQLNFMFRAFFNHPCFLGMTFHSDYARKWFVRLGIDEAKTCTAHNGYERSQFEPVLSKADARRLLNLPLDAKIAVYSGRINMKKGLGHILKIAKARPDVHFLFVGCRKNPEDDFETIARMLPNCHLYPWANYGELAKYLYASDIVMIPPTKAPLKVVGNTVLPIKLYAYIAAGRAIYAPIAPDTEELLTHDINAWLVTPDDEKAELDGFNQLIDDDERINRLSKAMAQEAAHLSWDDRAELVRDFMKSRLNIYKNH